MRNLLIIVALLCLVSCTKQADNPITLNNNTSLKEGSIVIGANNSILVRGVDVVYNKQKDAYFSNFGGILVKYNSFPHPININSYQNGTLFSYGGSGAGLEENVPVELSIVGPYITELEHTISVVNAGDRIKWKKFISDLEKYNRGDTTAPPLEPRLGTAGVITHVGTFVLNSNMIYATDEKTYVTIVEGVYTKNASPLNTTMPID